MPFSTEVGIGPGHIVLDGNQAPPPEAAQQPSQFSAHVYCGQTAGWIKMPLGTKVGLNPGRIVLDGDPASPRMGHNSPPLFCPCLLWPNGRPSQLLLSSCCTAHGRASLYFKMGRPFPSKLPLFLGPPEPSTQTAFRSNQPFLQGSLL